MDQPTKAAVRVALALLAACAAFTAHAGEAPGRALPPFNLPPVKTVDALGHRLAYHEKGSGPTLLLVHGCSGSAALEWGRVIDTLAVRHRVVAPYQIGFPPSAQPDLPYDTAAFVDHLGELMRRLDLKDVTLVGESFGGWVVGAYAVAMSRPGSTLPRIARLVVVDGALGLTPAALVENTSPPVPNPEVTALLKEHPTQGCQINKAASMDRIRAEFAKGPTAEELARLRVPTLVIWGDNDDTIRLSAGERLRDTIPGAKLVVIAGASHVPMLDHPAEFTEALLQFAGSR